jgi:hypothetical protein
MCNHRLRICLVERRCGRDVRSADQFAASETGDQLIAQDVLVRAAEVRLACRLRN